LTLLLHSRALADLTSCASTHALGARRRLD